MALIYVCACSERVLACLGRGCGRAKLPMFSFLGEGDGAEAGLSPACPAVGIMTHIINSLSLPGGRIPGGQRLFILVFLPKSEEGSSRIFILASFRLYSEEEDDSTALSTELRGFF